MDCYPANINWMYEAKWVNLRSKRFLGEILQHEIKCEIFILNHRAFRFLNIAKCENLSVCFIACETTCVWGIGIWGIGLWMYLYVRLCVCEGLWVHEGLVCAMVWCVSVCECVCVFVCVWRVLRVGGGLELWSLMCMRLCCEWMLVVLAVLAASVC